MDYSFIKQKIILIKNLYEILESSKDLKIEEKIKFENNIWSNIELILSTKNELDDNKFISNQKPDVFIWAFKDLETMYIQIQMLKYYNYFNDIYVYFPDNGKQVENRIINDSRFHDIESNVKKINFLQMNIELKEKNSYGLLECWQDYFKIHNDSNYTVCFSAQDIWLLDIFKFINYYSKLIFSKKDCLVYHSLYKEDTAEIFGNDYFIMKNDIGNNVFNNSLFKNNDPFKYEENFVNIIRSNYDFMSFNYPIRKREYIHQYGYSNIVGKVHVHSIEEKIHYINLWQNFYNHKLDFVKERLEKESKGATGKLLANTLNDNTATHHEAREI